MARQFEIPLDVQVDEPGHYEVSSRSSSSAAESDLLCPESSEPKPRASGMRGWQLLAFGTGLGLLVVAGTVLAVTLRHLGDLAQVDPGQNMVKAAAINSTTSSHPQNATALKLEHTQTPGEERLAVCCHHVTAFNIQPDVSWGTAPLEEQGHWMKWNCSGVLMQHFGTFEDTPTKCRSLGTPIYTFYMYRVTGDKDYAIENVNTASLGGVLWYLHNEVIVAKPRAFGITVMRRFKVQVAGTRALAKLNMTFGVRFAWDSQVCTGAGPWAWPSECEAQFKKYGHFIGCNNLGEYPFPTAAKGYPSYYPEAVWYSLPRNGRCHGNGRPTGEDNCTYNFEEVGNITIDELVGIKDYWKVPREYDGDADHGWGFSWWNHKYDEKACAQRWLHARDVWAKKFPGEKSDEDLPAPSCDFRCDFYENPPNECSTAQPMGAHACTSPGWCKGVQASYHAPAVGHYSR
jgi:hypothetical protein